MDSGYGYGKPYQGSKQKSDHMQKQLLDQHYSNNILMTVLSTLESLAMAYNKSSIRKEEKYYGHYDKVDYHDKSYAQLKSQLQVQLGVLKASRYIFDKEHSKGKYTMPASFDENQLKSEIKNFRKIFKGDNDVLGMISDLEEISKGNTTKQMNHEMYDYEAKYSKEEAERHKKETLMRGVHAARMMDIQKDNFDKMDIQDPKQNPVYLNKNSQYYLNRPQQRSHDIITG